MYMFNWFKKIINPDISSGFDGFPRFLTSCSPYITTLTVKREYKREPWDGGKSYQRDVALCWQFPYSHASTYFHLLIRLSSPPKHPFFRICVSPYLIKKTVIASLDLLENNTLEVVFVISGLRLRNLETSSRIV
jgi:hypothetical protein